MHSFFTVIMAGLSLCCESRMLLVVLFYPHNKLNCYFVGELCQQLASSLKTTRTHQGYAAVIRIMSIDPTLCQICVSAGDCFWSLRFNSYLMFLIDVATHTHHKLHRQCTPLFPVSILLSVFSKFYLFQFWTFGEIEHDSQKAWERDSRPMANYGLVLRC